MLRLKVVDGHITEAEQLVIRPEGGLTAAAARAPRPVSTGERVEKMGSPNPIFLQAIPEAKRPSREELIRTANYYFSGLQRNDGKGYYPFTDDCDRYENGNHATNVPMRNPATGPDRSDELQEAVRGGAEEHGIARARPSLRGGGPANAASCSRLLFSTMSRSTGPGSWASCSGSRTAGSAASKPSLTAPAMGTSSGWSTYEQGISDQPQIIR